VDHSDPEEAGVFRALLAHLLTPPPSKTHSRGGSVVDNFGQEDDPMTASSSPVRPNPPLSGISITGILSPSASAYSAAGGTISDTRFQQRTEIFERLMTFVNEDARQPDKDLMRMINVDQSEARMHYKA
jgi:muskelin